jgi:asparagine synthase (glutamine-hydrolysing)
LSGASLQHLRQLLLEPRTLERGLFRPQVLNRLFDEHTAGRRDHGNRIWRLLNLELWLRVCVEQDFGSVPATESGGAVAYS